MSSFFFLFLLRPACCRQSLPWFLHFWGKDVRPFPQGSEIRLFEKSEFEILQLWRTGSAACGRPLVFRPPIPKRCCFFPKTLLERLVVLDRAPENRHALHEVLDLHVFLGVVRAVLISHEDHRGGHARITQHGGVVAGAAGKAPHGNTAHAGRLHELGA